MTVALKVLVRGRQNLKQMVQMAIYLEIKNGGNINKESFIHYKSANNPISLFMRSLFILGLKSHRSVELKIQRRWDPFTSSRFYLM